MQSNKSTFLTADTSNPVLEAYKDLNKMIDEMDKKVEHVIKKHESQFLYAYRNHIAKIKKELTEIKHKSEQQEKMFSSNQRIQYLQREMVIFREQALKLYNRLDQKIQQNELLKNRLKQHEKQQEMLEYNQKEKRRNMKVQQINKTILQGKIVQLQQVIGSKEHQIAKLNKKIEVLKQQNHRRSIMHYKVASLSTSRPNQGLKDSQKVKMPQVYDSEMKQWFLQCIRTVKKQIAIRNNHNIMLELSHIKNVDQFKTVDKLRLLQLFLHNQKLLTWMYERIFPDRLSQMRYRLCSQSERKSSGERLGEQRRVGEQWRAGEQWRVGEQQRRVLPRVGRGVKSELRSSYVVKNGRLNISQFDKQ